MNWTNQTNQICFNEQFLMELILVSLKNGGKLRQGEILRMASGNEKAF